MKKLGYTVITVLVAMGWVSCLDTEEKVVINKDNSGEYSINIAMDGFMSQMQMLTGKSLETDGREKQQKDTTIYFKSFTDTATTLSDEEKAMLHDGKLWLHLDEISDEVKINLSVPFKNISQLPQLKKEFAAALKKMRFADKLMNKDASADLPEELAGAGGQFSQLSNTSNPFSSAFTFNVQGNKISNVLTDSTIINSMVSENSSLQMLQQLAPMMGSISYKSTYVLPNPVKSYKGGNSVVSADKKTISFTNNITDMFGSPSSMEYEVIY